MSGPRRVALAAALALLVVAGGIGIFFALDFNHRRASPSAPAPGVSSGPPVTVPKSGERPSVEAAPQAELPGKQPTPPEPKPEAPIEDLLAEVGEDPGAVYYTSRVREALREGNPAFARELFRQMKEQHPSSVLLEEAEALLREAR